MQYPSFDLISTTPEVNTERFSHTGLCRGGYGVELSSFN